MKRVVKTGARTAVVWAMTLLPPVSTQSPDTTPPELGPATLSPLGPVQYGNGIAGKDTVRGTGLGPWFVNKDGVTVTLTATDAVGVARFEYAIAPAADAPAPSVAFKPLRPARPGAPSATAAVKITDEGRNLVWYRAVDAAGNVSKLASIAVPIDTRAPGVELPEVPTTDIQTSRIGQSVVVVPIASDAEPGSGGVAIRAAEIDGKPAYPLPFDASMWPLGKHVWTLVAADAAGNASRSTFTFVVITTYVDLERLIDRYLGETRVAPATGAALKDKLLAAKTPLIAGKTPEALAALDEFVAIARRDVPPGPARTALVADGTDLQRQAREGGTFMPRDIGVTGALTKGPNPHLFVSPLPSSSLSGGRPNARFNVLLISNRADAFRHESIQTTERAIGELGRANNFGVDVYDYAFPDVSIPNPFTTIDALKKYQVIVGVSSVGNDTFSAARQQPDGSVVNEQQLLQSYLRQGGGFVALHGATDSMHTWEWYIDMVGAEFAGHGNNAPGMQPQCPSCNLAEVITEDASHPATQGFEKTWTVLDELYNFRSPPRERVHPLLLLNDATFARAIGGHPGNLDGNAIPGAGPDHPIAWCQNFEGGRVFTQALTHNWELSLDPKMQRSFLRAIEWAAGAVPGNCVTHREVTRQIAAARSAGTLTADAAARATSLVQAAYTKYLQKDYAGATIDIDALRALADAAESGDGTARAALSAKAQELRDWMTVLGRR